MLEFILIGSATAAATIGFLYWRWRTTARERDRQEARAEHAVAMLEQAIAEREAAEQAIERRNEQTRKIEEKFHAAKERINAGSISTPADLLGLLDDAED